MRAQEFKGLSKGCHHCNTRKWLKLSVEELRQKCVRPCMIVSLACVNSDVDLSGMIVELDWWCIDAFMTVVMIGDREVNICGTYENTHTHMATIESLEQMSRWRLIFYVCGGLKWNRRKFGMQTVNPWRQNRAQNRRWFICQGNANSKMKKTSISQVNTALQLQRRHPCVLKYYRALFVLLHWECWTSFLVWTLYCYVACWQLQTVQKFRCLARMS